MNPKSTKILYITLEEFGQFSHTYVLSGRKEGERVAKDLNLIPLFNIVDEIIFYIPDNIKSVNPSFLEGMLSPLIKTHTKEIFLQRIKWRWKYDISKDLSETVERVLRELKRPS